MDSKVSVIIPVYNGSKCLPKTINCLLTQDYGNFEIILVENNSSDNSWIICQELEKSDNRIRAFTVPTKGTTLARKYGVLKSEGEYILFHDQDDMIKELSAFSKMVKAIKQDGSDICQFGYIKAIGGIINKKVPKKSPNSDRVFARDEIMNSQIKGILGFGWSSDIVLDTTVWNKIYKADILREAVTHINESLYFCEDQYLNMFAFFSKYTQRVSVRNEYYYWWTIGVGFSSSEKARITILDDYKYIKKECIPLIKKYSTEDILYRAYWDSLTVYKWTIYGYLFDHTPEEKILDIINNIEEYQYIIDAKNELRKARNSLDFKDIDFLTSSYTSLEYYEYCKKTLPNKTIKSRLKGSIKSMILRFSTQS